MGILWLSSRDEADLLAVLRVANPTLAAVVTARLHDPLWRSSGPRTLLIRDEGDNLPPLRVAFDAPEDAEQAWREITDSAAITEELEWP